jgi:hypothetical protein
MNRRFLVMGLMVLASVGCEGVPASQGLNEPLRVQDGQLFYEPIPGLHPDDPEPAEGPRLTAISLTNFVVYHAASDKRLAGRAEDTAVAVGIAMPTLTDHHWVIPAGSSDPQHPGEVTWITAGSFNPDIPPGIHPLHAVAIDENGVAGRQRRAELCVRYPFEDNFSTCDPSNAPPPLVISLHWDVDADVDLEIVTPTGRRITPRRPRVDPDDPNSPQIDRDSLRACEPDGMRRESIVFQERPTGQWQFYARLFEGCGRVAVRYNLEIYEAQGTPPDAQLVKVFERPGLLISEFDARGPDGPGTFIAYQQFD